MDKKQMFKIAYLENGNVSESCKKVGVSETQAYKWLNGGLREEIRAVNDERLQGYLTLLLKQNTLVANELIDIILNKQSPPNVKIQAVKAYNDILKTFSDSEILERLDALENNLNFSKEN